MPATAGADHHSEDVDMNETPRPSKTSSRRWWRGPLIGAGLVLLLIAVVVPLAVLIDRLVDVVPLPVWVALSVFAIIGRRVARRWGHDQLSQAFAAAAVVCMIIPAGAVLQALRGQLWLELLAGLVVIGGVALLLGGPSRSTSAPGSSRHQR
jgi:hypothetical protein